MEKLILIGGIIILLIGLIFSKPKKDYQCHSCKKHFHKKDLEIKGWHFKEWVCPNCKHLNYTYNEKD